MQSTVTDNTTTIPKRLALLRTIEVINITSVVIGSTAAIIGVLRHEFDAAFIGAAVALPAGFLSGFSHMTRKFLRSEQAVAQAQV